MNDTGSRRSLDTLADGPLADFVGTSGEETGQVQRCTHGGDHPGQSRLGAQLLALLERLLLSLELGKALLERGGEGEQRVTRRVVIDPLLDNREVLVLLANVVSFAQVDKVDNWLSSEELEGVDDLNLEVVSAMHTKKH